MANEPDEKVVIFSQWGDVLRMFEVALKECNIGYVVCGGAAVQEFNNKPEVSRLLFLISSNAHV